MIKTKFFKISNTDPTYFIADISANHDGSLSRAKKLIELAAKSGANAAKFQNFKAENIVSDLGFKKIGSFSHQANWDKSVFDIYKSASLPWEWTKELKTECDKNNIDFFSTPYDLKSVDMLNKYVDMFKLGSGDINFLDLINKIAVKKKPILIATGASTLSDVIQAVNIYKNNSNNDYVLMQCNTNYTGSFNNFKYINLNVLKNFKNTFPDAILGLSDHTKTLSTVLGSVALGAKVIEKHFTDDNTRQGPDHSFSIMPDDWKKMVERTRELELSFGTQIKDIEKNEKETVIIQRRSIRIKNHKKKGTKIKEDDLTYLRPCPENAFSPDKKNQIIGRILNKDLPEGECICQEDLNK